MNSPVYGFRARYLIRTLPNGRFERYEVERPLDKTRHYSSLECLHLPVEEGSADEDEPHR